MNLSEIKARLEKLNNYYNFLATIPDNISAIERDTFLMQLRALYEVVLEKFDSSNKKEPIQEQPVVKEEPKGEESLKEEKNIKKSTQFVFTNTEQPEKKEETKKEPIIEKKPEEKVVVEPLVKVVEKKEEPIIEPTREEPKAEAKPITETAKKEPVIVEPREEKKETSVSNNEQKETAFSEDFAELFMFKQATDLAAKLSESPIHNLSQVLGLNEKFYYINELFGGDAAKFNQAVDFLNTVGDFDRARTYMEEQLIEQLGWMKKEKKNLAKEFVKLVRRRYL